MYAKSKRYILHLLNQEPDFGIFFIGDYIITFSNINDSNLKNIIINPYTGTTAIGGFSSINKLTSSGIEQGVTFLNPTPVGTNVDYEGIQITTCYKAGGCSYAQRLENSPINFAGANTSSEAGMSLVKLNY